MNIKRAKQEIKDAVEAYLLKDEYGTYEIPVVRQRPILLLGAPGIGKTQIMEQIARECGIGLVAYTITHHTRQSAIGLPFISEMEFGGQKKAVTEYTMSEIVASIYEKMKKTGLNEGILFIDEINCVSETLAPAMLQFLQCKTFGNHPIPEGWIIVAAGNPPEYNKSVRDFDVVTLVMEHTGRYYEALAHQLSAADLFVSAVNPKLVKDFNNDSLRKIKSDKADSVKIARYALDKWQSLEPYSITDELRAQLKVMNRQFHFYVKQKTAMKNNLIGLIDQTYPNANTYFNSPTRSDGSQKWVDFVSTYWHVDCIRKMSLNAFVEHYQN